MEAVGQGEGRLALGVGCGHLAPVGATAEPSGGVRLSDGQSAGVVCGPRRAVDESLDRVARSLTDDGWAVKPFPPTGATP